MKKQQGFTLIELMIVVAIIGILAAIAIPQYQNYIARSQMNRAVGEVAALKTAVEENLMRGVVNFTVADLGYVQSSLTGAMIISDTSGAPGAMPAAANFEADGSGTLNVELGTAAGGNASTAINGTIIIFSRTNQGAWTCGIDNTDPVTATTWDGTFLPVGCAVLTAAVNP